MPSFIKKHAIAATIMSALLLMIIGFFSLQASNDRAWLPQYAKLPIVDIDGDIITINNVRDFRYQSSKDGGDNILEPRYIQRQFKLSEIKQLWYGISHFAEHGFAHVFLSFEFSQGQFLIASVEARLEQQHSDGYNPFTGLFRQYQKTLVLATEEDVIGLRTHLRKEQVYLYPIQLSEVRLRALLLNHLRSSEDLLKTPSFYNSFSDNCMTGLLKVTSTLNHWWQWLDYRIILPGYSDQILFQQQPQHHSKVNFEQWQEQHLIHPGDTHIGSPNFSIDIRQRLKD